TISRRFGLWLGTMPARSTRLESSRCRASAEPAGNRKPDLVPYAARGSVSGMAHRPPRSIQGGWRGNRCTQPDRTAPMGRGARGVRVEGDDTKRLDTVGTAPVPRT